MKPKVLNAEPQGFSAEARERLTSFADLREGPLTRAQLLVEVREVEGLIVRLGHRIDEEVFACAPRLRVVSSATTGLDHVDLGAAGRFGVTVISLQGERAFLDTVRATVEHTFALLLTLLRMTHRASAHAEAGGWDRDLFRGRELADRTLGIVGLGRIGSAVAEVARAFRMRICAYDPYLEVWPAGVERVPTLTALFQEADVVTLHCPLNAGTRDLVGAAELARLPRGAILVNTARGGVLDEGALLAALESGQLGGAALDVQKCEESGRANQALLDWAASRSNLILTPHIGGATLESMRKTELFMAEKLERALSGSSAAAGQPGAGDSMTTGEGA